MSDACITQVKPNCELQKMFEETLLKRTAWRRANEMFVASEAAL